MLVNYSKNLLRANQALHLTPKARAFFASAISVQNFAYAKSSLAFGAGELYVRGSKCISMSGIFLRLLEYEHILKYEELERGKF